MLSQPPVEEAVVAEVRELLEGDLLRPDVDEAAKVAALRTLGDYFDTDHGAYPQTAEHRRAVKDWNGCHLVLVALQRELAKADDDGPRRDVVLEAIRFLPNWCIGSPERCAVLSRFQGVAGILEVAKAFPNDGGITAEVIRCFLRFSSDEDPARLNEIVQGDALEYIVQAMSSETHKDNAALQRCALTILERATKGDDGRRRDRLIQKGAVIAAAAAYATFLESDDGILTLCAVTLGTLVVPP